MNENQPNSAVFPSFTAENGPKPKSVDFKKLLLALAAGIVILFIGAGIGSATKPAAVPVAPASCIDALEKADTAFGYAGNAIGYAGDALSAVSRLNASAIRTANANIDNETEKLKDLAPHYNESKAACRATAGK